MRKRRGLTQSGLGERLNVSFQAVSNWERGETLPDVGLLLDLAAILETTVDYLLTGGQAALRYRGKINVADMREGIDCIRRMGELLGRENLIYRCAVEGINGRMNTDIEACFQNENVLECFVAEAIIQNLKAGFYVELAEVKDSFQNRHFYDVVCQYAAQYRIQ